MSSRRADRSGLRVAGGGGDLIEDIHRQHRRRLLKRAAQLTTLAIALLLLGVGLKTVADRRARGQALRGAAEHFDDGTVADVKAAITVLESSLERDPDHTETLRTRSIMRAHQWLEFGVGEDEARRALLGDGSEADQLAEAILAFAAGDLDTAQEIADSLESPSDDLVVTELAWLRGLLAAALHASEPDELAAAIEALDVVLDEEPQWVAHRRIRALLLLLSGDRDAALSELERARDQSSTHMGLAADEALYNAYLHQELGGVASVADQLLEADHEGLSPRDRAHARLARGVVHIRLGEPKKGIARLVESWDDLAEWNRLARELAIQTKLEAGDAEGLDEWLEDSGLPDSDRDIYRAWSTFASGDVMKALELLSALPQEHPWVACVQALALVEQRRFAEAAPWIERTEKMLPGRPDIEVARARVELWVGDKKVALRKLKALAEEEPYAPRAWTGLGEAYLEQEETDGAEVDLKAAKRALQKAIETEPIPAEAMLRLAQVWDDRRGEDPEAERKALELLESAVKANEKLPRYVEELGLYLADLGYDDRARKELGKTVKMPGVTWRAVIRLISLSVGAEIKDVDYDQLLEQAEELGAEPLQLTRARASVAVLSEDKAKLIKEAKQLAELLEQNPADVDSRVLYAMTQLKLLDRKAAETAVRRGFSTTPEKHHGRLFLTWARIEARAGKQATAAPRARSAWLRMLEEDRPARELLDAAELAARLWSRQNKDRVALAIARQLTKRMAYHSEAWTIRAVTEHGSGEAAEGRQSAERAIALDPENPRAHEIRGHCLLRFGNKDEAKASYTRALELAKGSPQEKRYRDNLRRL